MTGTITLSVLPQANSQYHCQLSSSLADRPSEDLQCYGQTPEHAIALALEKLADRVAGARLVTLRGLSSSSQRQSMVVTILEQPL